MKSVLTVGLCRRDRNDLKEILAPPGWRIQSAEGCQAAYRHLNWRHFTAVFCESALIDGDWKDILRHLSLSHSRPPLIVTSRLADVNLWAEVLNLGGFDVVLTPFERNELLGVVQQASCHTASQTRVQASCSSASPLEAVKVA